MEKTYGKCEWLIADAFWESHSNGIYPSHEAVCVLNCGDIDAKLEFTLYFEDREPMTGFTALCGARRTHHVRMDKLVAADGSTVPIDVPYAILLKSSVPVVAQYSRLDSAQAEMTLMTTIAY